MRFFDYEKVAQEAHIAPRTLADLRRLIRQDFPEDEMMYELHLLRVCMAIREGILTSEEALRREPAAT
jgi:hypothetical protein